MHAPFLTALRDPNPVVFAESIGLYRTKGDVPAEDYALPFGKAAIKRAAGMIAGREVVA